MHPVKQSLNIGLAVVNGICAFVFGSFVAYKDMLWFLICGSWLNVGVF